MLVPDALDLYAGKFLSPTNLDTNSNLVAFVFSNRS